MAATAPPTGNTGLFRGLLAIVASAAAAATAVFALFSSFLTTLVPPIVDAKHSVQFGTFGTAIILLALSLIVQRKLSSAKTRYIGFACLAAVVISGVLFLHFKAYSRDYVYRFPPQSLPSASQELHVRGELHEEGIKRVGKKTIAQAVYDAGGPTFVDSNGVLWMPAAKLRTIEHLEFLYLALASLLTFTLFLAALVVWRSRNR